MTGYVFMGGLFCPTEWLTVDNAYDRSPNLNIYWLKYVYASISKKSFSKELMCPPTMYVSLFFDIAVSRIRVRVFGHARIRAT